MKYLKKLQTMKLFTLADVVELTHNTNTANSLISSYKKSGFIASVRKNLYVALDIVSGNPVASRYEIASKTTISSFVSHHSAMEYHGVANQVFFEVTISAKEKIRPFSYDGLSYRSIQTDIPEGVITPPYDPLVKVSNIERTLIDCLYNTGLAGGLEELLECMNLIPQLNETELIKYLELYNQKILWQKAGFVLEQYSQQFRLSKAFFAKCREKIGARKNYLNKSKGLIYYPEWRLYAPADLFASTKEGEDILV